MTTWRCSDCSFTFVSRQSLVEHFTKHHAHVPNTAASAGSKANDATFQPDAQMETDVTSDVTTASFQETTCVEEDSYPNATFSSNPSEAPPTKHAPVQQEQPADTAAVASGAQPASTENGCQIVIGNLVSLIISRRTIIISPLIILCNHYYLSPISFRISLRRELSYQLFSVPLCSM